MEVALLGSGLFASRCHAPALKAGLRPATCAASGPAAKLAHAAAWLLATRLASSFGETCRALWGDQGLRDLLADAQLQAVFVCLPLDVQPLYIQKALEAGKHVFSEKPVAADGKAAKELIHLYRTDFAPQRLRWAVGENYRYEAGLLRAAEVARSLDLVTLEMNVHSPMPPENDFFKTSWRQKPSWQGGFFQDGAVHFAAALRMLAGSRPLRVWATCVTKSKHLPPPDTLAGVVDFGEVDNVWHQFLKQGVFQSGTQVLTFADSFEALGTMQCHVARSVETAGGFLRILGLKNRSIPLPKTNIPPRNTELSLFLKRHVLLSRSLQRMSPNTTVLVVDAFDVLLQRSLTEVLQTYERLAGRTRTRWAGRLSVTPVVFGGETGCDE
ncbi:unnamed protein product [Effrenium voratum]|nr:unnamed protein product [Effrenium voratum]